MPTFWYTVHETKRQTGVFAPEIVKEMELDGMSIEFGSYEHGWPLSQRKLQDWYLRRQQELGIEYPNVGVSDGDNVPFHARPGTKWDEIVNAQYILGTGTTGFQETMRRLDEDYYALIN